MKVTHWYYTGVQPLQVAEQDSAAVLGLALMRWSRSQHQQEWGVCVRS